MKVSQYVEKYLPRFSEPGIDEPTLAALNDLVNDLIREYNAEARSLKITKRVDADRLVDKYNAKGNLISDRLNAKRGKHLLKSDWFKTVIAGFGAFSKELTQ